MDNVRPFYLIAVDGLKDEYLCRDDFVIDPALRVAPANLYFPSATATISRSTRRPRRTSSGPSALFCFPRRLINAGIRPTPNRCPTQG